jgi:dihydroxy-acid dehydratase
MGMHRGRPEDITEAYYRGLMHAVGFRRQDLEKPQIVIVNSWTDANPGHKPLRGLSENVREGIWSAGGCPTEFNVPAPCDGMAQGPGQHYVLPQRDLIAASTEAMVQTHGFEGMVMLASCDKIIPGMLMAAARLKLPTLFLTAGAMLPCEMQDRSLVTSDLKEAIGQRRAQRMDAATFLARQQQVCPSAGTCSMMGTANTMGCFLEALGLAPLGSATMLAFDAAKIRQARDVGERIVGLVKDSLSLGHFLTADSLENGIKIISASGGSSNALLHVMALARSLDLDLDLRRLDQVQASVPVVARFKPSSNYTISDYHRAGGVAAVLNAIKSHLQLDAALAMGGRLRDVIDSFPLPDGQVVHPASDPVEPDGCFGILYGNLAPRGAVVKKSAVEPEMRKHTGPAVVFDSE